MKPWEMMRRFGPAAGGGGGGAGNPYWANTVVQLHYEGGTIVDSSASPKALVLNSPGSLSTARAKFGTQAFAAAGTPSYVEVTPNSALVLGTGDFTFDTWFCPNTVAPSQQILFDTRSTSSNTGGFAFGLWGANLGYYDLSAARISSFALPADEFTHLEITRVAGVMYIFGGGSLVLSRADTNDYSNGRHFIGAAAYTPIGAAAANGYFDETRLIAGVGVHTSDFTPPTAPYPDGP